MNLHAGMFDVRSVSIAGPVIRGHVCLTVEYVDGHELPPCTLVLFKCTCNQRKRLSSPNHKWHSIQCTQLPPHTSYDIIATA